MYLEAETRNQVILTGFIYHRRQVLCVGDVPILRPVILRLSHVSLSLEETAATVP
jgi:hypothetical protein